MAFVFHLDGVNESIKGELAGFEVQQLLSSQQKTGEGSGGGPTGRGSSASQPSM